MERIGIMRAGRNAEERLLGAPSLTLSEIPISKTQGDEDDFEHDHRCRRAGNP